MLISAHRGSASLRPPTTLPCLPSGVMLLHVRPPSSERCTSPSSVPHQSRLRRCADSASAKIVQYTSAPVLSRVTGPPEGPSFEGSLRVKSLLTTSQLAPLLVERCRCCEAAHNTSGS